jgi:hypothetical protein
MVCFVRQSLETARMLTDDEKMQERVVRKIMKESASFDMHMAPPVMSQQIFRIIRETLGVADPYLEAKRRFNDFALGMKDNLRQRVTESENPWATATKLAIAGNIIDFGVHNSLDEAQVEACIHDALAAEFDTDQVKRFAETASRAKEILYLADNAGEIVFDQLLLELMPLERVTVAVKGGPIINDALLADARETGLTDMVRVIDNGTDAPGTILEQCREEFREHFARADMIISKGQGNYETLSESNRPIWFLLKVKCPVVSKHLNLPLGTLALVEPTCPA